MATATATKVQPPKLTSADRERITIIQQAQAAYRGAFDPPLKREESTIAWIRNTQTPDFNVLVNRCGPVVDVGLEFLFGEPFTLEVDARTPRAKLAQDYLEDAWGDPDDMLTLWGEIGLNGFIGGQGIAKVLLPTDDDDPPTFSATEPEYVSVITDPQDRRKAIGYQIRYRTGEGLDALGYCQYISQASQNPKQPNWIIQDFVSKGQGAAENWQLTDEQEWRIGSEWLPFCPIQDCQNLTETREYWGRSDLTPDVIGVNKAVILNASNYNKIVWHFAFPWVYASGFEGELEPEPGRAIKFPSPDSKLAAVNFSNDLPAITTHIQTLMSHMDEITGVPGVATGRIAELPRGTISGIALEMLYQRLIAKTKKKRRLYGKLMRKLSQIILYFGGFDVDADSVKVHIHWPDMLPVDALQSWQAAILQQQLEVSKHTIFAERNLSYDTEQELKAKEAEDEQAAFDAGTGPAPAAIAAGNAPLPPEMQQNQQNPPPEFQAQQDKLTGGQ